MDRSHFSDAEWQTLRDAPHLAAMAVASSGASGFFGTLKEAVTASSAAVDGMKNDNALVAALSARDELKSSQAALKERLEAMSEGIQDRAELRDRAAQAALDEVRSAVSILESKGSGADLAAYRAFIRDMGVRVAEAAKEGSFLGLGGERVSDAEVEMLERLDGALHLSA